MLSNTATVSSSTTDPNTANDSDTETTAVQARADLSISKDDSPDPVTAGGSLSYTITVDNAGPSDAQAVTVSDSCRAVDRRQCQFIAGQLRGVPVEPGNHRRGQQRHHHGDWHRQPDTPDATVLSNTATVSSTTTDPNTANDSDTETTAVEARANLSITKDDSPDPVTAGGTSPTPSRSPMPVLPTPRQ